MSYSCDRGLRAYMFAELAGTAAFAVDTDRVSWRLQAAVQTPLQRRGHHRLGRRRRCTAFNLLSDLDLEKQCLWHAVHLKLYAEPAVFKALFRCLECDTASTTDSVQKHKTQGCRFAGASDIDSLSLSDVHSKRSERATSSPLRAPQPCSPLLTGFALCNDRCAMFCMLSDSHHHAFIGYVALLEQANDTEGTPDQETPLDPEEQRNFDDLDVGIVAQARIVRNELALE